jgi:hypothetical protein
MRYLVVVEKGPSSYGAYVPDLPGCVAAGESRGGGSIVDSRSNCASLRGIEGTVQPISAPTSTSDHVEVV